MEAPSAAEFPTLPYFYLYLAPKFVVLKITVPYLCISLPRANRIYIRQQIATMLILAKNYINVMRRRSRNEAEVDIYSHAPGLKTKLIGYYVSFGVYYYQNETMNLVCIF